jgi:hypothetical protein
MRWIRGLLSVYVEYRGSVGFLPSGVAALRGLFWLVFSELSRLPVVQALVPVEV